MKKLDLLIVAVIINFTALFLSFNLNLFAQMPYIKWQKSFGGAFDECAQSVAKTQDGGYIIAGYSNSYDADAIGNHGNYDCLIIKMDSIGIIQWKKCFGGSCADMAYSVKQTIDGGYIISGATWSNDYDVSGNHGGSDCWIIKLNLLGAIQWQKCIGGSGDEEGYSIEQAEDGGYIFCGFSSSNDGDILNNHGIYDCLVVKLNAIGDIQWQKNLGGTGDEMLFSIKPTSDNGYVVAGYSQSNNGDITGNIGNCDYLIMKLNSAGNIIWQKSFGGTDTDFALSIKQTEDNGFIVVGRSDSNDDDAIGNHGGTDCLIIKTDSVGTMQWEKIYGGAGADYLYSIQQTAEEGYIAVGYSNSDSCNLNHNGDCWIVKMNSLGNVVWERCFGGSGTELAYCIEKINNSDFIFAGMSNSNDGDIASNHSNSDFLTVKFSFNSDNIESANLFFDIRIYPNPAENFINIDFDITTESELCKFELCDFLGQVVFDKNFKIQKGKNKFIIPIDKISSGVYLFHIYNNISSFNKIIIKK